jgi:hypothetical protein
MHRVFKLTFKNYFTFVSEDSTQKHLKIACGDVWP